MTGPTFRTFSPVPRGGPGLACDESGLALGPIALSRKLCDPYRGVQYRLLPVDEMKQILRIAYGSVHGAVIERRCRGIARATQLLNTGSDALARIHAVLLAFPEISPDGMAKLAAVASLRKYNPDEPRVPAGNPDGGQWTSGGDGGGTPQTSAGGASPLLGAAIGAIASDAITAAGSLLGDIGAAATAGLEALGGALSGPAAFLGFIFIPTNSVLTATGTLPGQPDIDYSLDQDTGHLLLYRNGEVLFDGMPGSDGLYHGTDGSTFGRMVNGTMVLDPAVLPGIDASPDTAATSDADAGAQATRDTSSDQPKLCPDPTADRPGGKSDRAQAYQEQITGLPPGLAVALNGVVFDGCRESDGTMLEAKGPGYAWAMTGPDAWMNNYTGVEGIMDQAGQQSTAAAGRAIEWHFAEGPVADYFREAFASKGWSNITAGR